MFIGVTPTILRPSLLAAVASTWDPNAKAALITLSNNNKTATRTGANAYKSVKGALSRNSGSYGFEVTLNASPNGNDYIGLASTNENPEGTSGGDGQNTAYYPGGFYSGPDGSLDSGFTYSNGSVIGIFFNKSANTIDHYVNGSFKFSRSLSGASGPFFPTACLFASGSSVTLNTGPLAYPASGFAAWG